MTLGHPHWQLRLFINMIFFLTAAKFNEVYATHEDCPWYKRDEGLPDDIKSNCICATNVNSGNQLSIQCHDVNAATLVLVLQEFRAGTTQPLELLYLNGSKVTDGKGVLLPNLFSELRIISLQLSGCNIKSVQEASFTGNENYLKHLSLSQNEITSVPSSALQKLDKLSLLDLSYNKITKIGPGAFDKLTKLATLKLNDNNLELHAEAFSGLEKSLRNLNLKGTRISQIPEAVNNLSAVAFLDLAQNRLRELEPSQFLRMHSLTALNLERNLLQSLQQNAFEGVNDTLSSLSLLNNLITTFPRSALRNLHELRVLDLGFNLLTEVPKGAFSGLKSLTLLALDGNPLDTISETAFAPLNTTLRGISLGGRFLNCDCRLRWILEWVQAYDLQVTSRERNPQFCGSPALLRDKTFYQFRPSDLICTKNVTTASPNFDVSLSPEDMALLGMSSSSVFVSKSESSASTENKSVGSQEQEPEENRTTFTLEAPLPARNVTTPKFKPRRNRPKFGKIIPTSTTTTTPKTHPSSSTSKSDSAVSESIESFEQKEVASKDSSERKFSQEDSRTQDVDDFVLSEENLQSSTKRTSLFPASRPPSVRTNPGRHRVTPKLFLSSATTTTTSTIMPSTTRQTEIIETEQQTSTRASVQITQRIPTSSSPTVKPKPVTPSQKTIPPTSKTIDALDIDESKIPVISGIGSSLSNPNLHNTGSVLSVKQPTPHLQPHGRQHPDPPPPPYHHPSQRPSPPNLIFADKPEIVVQEIERSGDAVTLHWESQRLTSGFRIIYRLFGEDAFRHGPPLASTETEYKIKNIPNNECIVVCVVPYEEILYNEISPSAATIPPGSQCREVKPNPPSALMNNMDKITIGASAAICVTVLIAVVIFIAVTRRSKTKRPSTASTLIAKLPPTSFVTPSPQSNMVNSSASFGITKDWDQISVVSAKSIPRARVFHGSMDGLSNNTMKNVGYGNFQRGLGPEGAPTHRSFSVAHHHHHNHNSSHGGHNYHHHHQYHGGNGNGHNHGTAAAAANNYLNNQNRLLRTSLGSRASYDALNKLTSSRHSHHHIDNNFRRKRSSRNQSESLHTLNGYETPDNWTDHDMDFYVARNHTRHDLVQL